MAGDRVDAPILATELAIFALFEIIIIDIYASTAYVVHPPIPKSRVEPE